MIEKYKIVKTKNEEVLYLYLNSHYEFSSEFLKKENFTKELDRIIKKIQFHGQKIYIMSASLALATILLTNKIDQSHPKYTYISSSTLEPIIQASERIEYENEKEQEGQKEEIKEEQETIKKEDNNSNTSKDTTNNNKKEHASSNKNSSTKKPASGSSENKQSSTTKKPSTNTQKPSTNKKPNTSTQKPSTNTQKPTNQTIVTIYRSSGKVEKIELEEYLIGVVGAEMPASFNSEALKAQAILARTYALKAIQTNKKLTDTVSTQTYKDNTQLKQMWGSSYTSYYNKIKSAVDATKGLTVKYNGGYIEALYFSTSNGYTENAENVFTNAFPYLQTVESPWDKNVSSYLKTVTLNYQDVLKKLGVRDTKATIEIISRNKSNRVQKVKVGNKEYTGVEFRMTLGLRSADFDLEKDGNHLKVTTRGYGHGVGMSQYGANEMAKKGNTYQQIIKHYYKGVTISK